MRRMLLVSLDMEEAVQRHGAAAARDQGQQQRRPAEVGRPSVRLDEDLDHQGHRQQGRGGSPREEPEQEKHREEMLCIGRRMSGQLRRDQGHAVLLLEERVGSRRDGNQAFDLGAAQQEEGGGGRVRAPAAIRRAPTAILRAGTRTSLRPHGLVDILPLGSGSTAPQPYVDGAISKTVNHPEDQVFDAFAAIHDCAYERRLEGCAAFRAVRAEVSPPR